MLIQYNPRLLLNRTHFHALSVGHLLEYLSNVSEDKEKEKVWLDMRDVLHNGSLFRWLKSMGWETGKIKSIQELITPYDLVYDMLNKVTEKLFEAIESESKKKLHDYLQYQAEREKNSKSYDWPTIGRNWVVTLSDDPKVKLELVWVAVKKDGKPYDFYMGSEDKNDWATPVHREKLTHGYWIGKYQLTQEQWDIIGVKRMEKNYFRGKHLPVEMVCWDEAKEYCRKMQKIFQSQLQEIIEEESGRKIHYEFNLPTEAQWEFAAKGGVLSKGYEYSGSDDIGEVAWYNENSGNELLYENMCQTHLVGLKVPNELGIHDMSGNVWEWCQDDCDWEFETFNLQTGIYIDDIEVPSSTIETYYVIRGGAWCDNAFCCRSTYRNYRYPSNCGRDIGFRVAVVPVQG